MTHRVKNTDHPLFGKTVGSYVVHSLIGRGGMGDVYELLHPAIKKKMALKVLHKRFKDNKTATRRFFEEARAVNLVDSPFVVDVVDFEYLDDGRPYIVMEYLDGTNLKEHLKNNASLTPEQCKILFNCIFSGLEKVHAAGITHRDLKPSNIFLVDGDLRKVKILDFGIAKIKRLHEDSDGLTKSNAILGSLSYMSPEQAQGNSSVVDCRSDIYSLGLILFRVLSGSNAFKGDTPAAYILQHSEKNTPRLLTYPHWNPIVQKATAKKREERYQSVAEFREALINCPIHRSTNFRRFGWLAISIPLLGVLLLATHIQHKQKNASISERSGRQMSPYNNTKNDFGAEQQKKTTKPPLPRDSFQVTPLETKKNKVQYGNVLLKATPWALVFVDGKKLGQTPIRQRLSVGSHRLRFENHLTKSVKRKKITVVYGETTVIQMKMEKSSF